MSSPGIVVRLDRKALTLVAAVILVATLGRLLWSEVLTLVTTYPAPSAIYNQIVTTGDSGTSPADTTLSRNTGNTILTPPSNTSGRVGVGTANPAAKLDVAGGLGASSLRLNGSMQVGGDSTACTAAKAGTLRWNAGKVEVCDGSAWKP